MSSEFGVKSLRFKIEKLRAHLLQASSLCDSELRTKLPELYGDRLQKRGTGSDPRQVLFDAPMRRYTSMRVGGPADSLIFPEDVNELKKVVLYAGRKSIPVFILGKART